MPGRPDADRPTHPRLAAALLVCGVVILIVALSIAPLLTR
jgi:hypothetical protein